jgi:hypothetical protein
MFKQLKQTNESYSPINCWLKPQSIHRVATAAFPGVHSIMMGKLAQGGEGGMHAHPLSLHLPSRTKLQYTLQLSGYRYTDPISSLHYIYSVVEALAKWRTQSSLRSLKSHGERQRCKKRRGREKGLFMR